MERNNRHTRYRDDPRSRSVSPADRSSKHARVEGNRKGKEPVRSSDALEPGEIEVEKKIQHDIGDDFIPFQVGEDEDTVGQHERLDARQKGKEPEREWDKGKLAGHVEESRSRGTKRKHDDLSDDDSRRYRRTEWPISRSAPWVNDVDWDSCRNVAEMLHREVEAFVKYMSPTPIEDEVRSFTVSLVSRVIRSAFPDARISPFGSYETKLYLPDGDIDLVVDSESMAHSNKVHVLYHLANTIKRAGITSKFTVIAKAKVPIIKFVTNYGRLNVDLSINQGNGVTAGKVINGFLQNMYGCGSALRSLVLVVKAFLHQRGMNEGLHRWSGKLQHSVPCYKLPSDAPKNQEGRNRCREEPWGPRHGVLRVGWRRIFQQAAKGMQPPFLEDPIDPTNDISKGSYGIAKVRQTFAGAYEIMQATVFLRAGILDSRREGRDYPLRRQYDPGDLSILSGILGVTREVGCTF
ncbi:hypothetical protein BKA83DRAFT_117132 [Pisolithus microcarpus]|nr:hypothetical protein BKA83DRAFT_117132 [Pisolithus microcarpus]